MEKAGILLANVRPHLTVPVAATAPSVTASMEVLGAAVFTAARTVTLLEPVLLVMEAPTRKACATAAARLATFPATVRTAIAAVVAGKPAIIAERWDIFLVNALKPRNIVPQTLVVTVAMGVMASVTERQNVLPRCARLLVLALVVVAAEMAASAVASLGISPGSVLAGVATRGRTVTSASDVAA